ncbi:MAG TPA: hypothetical protein VIG64_03135 [Actinomycetota bacterium]|jgi:hypothetical protein
MKSRLGALALVLMLAGCGGDGVDASSPDEPVTAAPAPGAPGNGSPRVVQPEPGLVRVIPSAWERATPARGGRSVRLTWYSGVEECYGLDHVDVDYKEKVVVVTLFAGSRPEAETCIELAERVVTEVDLDEPLGDRRLVDGSRVR